ncbi:MAG: hypothetical protein LBP58_03020 [Azoarcus sp.]|jgi:hypothetical protein|nr:hypothetical protein [Azoarcus sp.]
MAFNGLTIAREPTVIWPVTVRLPDDGGTLGEHRITAYIRVYSEREYAKLVPAAAEEIAPRALAEVLAENARLFPRFIVDWEGVTDEAGEPVPVGQLPEIIQGPYGGALSAALWRAIAEVRFGIDASGGATEKNSVPSPAP